MSSNPESRAGIFPGLFPVAKAPRYAIGIWLSFLVSCALVVWFAISALNSQQQFRQLIPVQGVVSEVVYKGNSSRSSRHSYIRFDLENTTGVFGATVAKGSVFVKKLARGATVEFHTPRHFLDGWSEGQGFVVLGLTVDGDRYESVDESLDRLVSPPSTIWSWTAVAILFIFVFCRYLVVAFNQVGRTVPESSLD